MTSHYEIRSGKQIEQDHKSYLMEQPLLVRCAKCRWTFTGTASDAIASAKAHRERKHPQLRRSRKLTVEHHRRHNAPTVSNAKTISDNLTGARTQGAAAWLKRPPCAHQDCFLTAVPKSIYCHEHERARQRQRRQEAA